MPEAISRNSFVCFYNMNTNYVLSSVAVFLQKLIFLLQCGFVLL